MKKAILLSFLMILFVGVSFAQTTPTEEPAGTEIKATDASGPDFTFSDGNDDTTLDYGTIQQHSEPLRTVTFKNTGTEPLIIKNARGSCGCTVPTWEKEPIMPGEESVIEVRYATNRLGKFSKKVTITTNEDVKHVINVVGNVLKAEEEETVPKKEDGVIGGGN